MIPVSRSPAIVIAAGLYALGTAAIAVWASRRIRSAGDFFVAGRRIGPVTLGLGSMAVALSGFTFIGGPGLFYDRGFGALFIFLPVSITASLSACLLGKRLSLLGEARGLVTIPEAIGARYGCRTAQGLAGVAILVAIVGYLATNLLALGLVIDSLFDTGVGPGIWIGAAAVIAYSISGGILAGIYTDVFQGLVMALASFLVFLVTLEVGDGLAGMTRTILEREPGWLSPWGEFSPLAAVSLFFVFSVGSLGQPHVIHKFYLLRDPLKLRWYPLAMTLAMIVVLLVILGVGFATKALVLRGAIPPLSHPDEATPAFLLRYASPALAGVLFAGVVAAIMSTVNSFLNIGAAALVRDLPGALGRRPRSELRAARLATLALGTVAAIAAQASGTLVVLLGVFGWGLFAATLVPALALGLNWAGGTRLGALASMSTGLGLTLVGELLGFLRVYSLPDGVTVSGAALVLSLLVYLAVSVLSRRGSAPPAPDVRLIMES